MAFNQIKWMIRATLLIGLIAATVGLLPVRAQGSFEKIAGSNLDKLKLLNTFVGHMGNVLSMAFSADGNWLASGSVDTSARLWNVQNPTESQSGLALQGHTKQVAVVGFSPDSKTLITGSYDDSLRTWDIASGKQTAVQGTPGPAISNLVNAFTPDMSLLLYGQDGNGPGVWDVNNDVEFGPALTTDGVSGFTWFAIAPDGQSVYMGDGHDGKIYLVPINSQDIKPEDRKLALSGADNSIYDGPLAVSPDGNWLAAATSSDGSVDLFDVKSGKLQATLAANTDELFIMFTPDSSLLLISSSDGPTWWDAKTGKQVGTLPEKNVLAVAFNSAGTLIAVSPPQIKSTDPVKIELWGVPAQ